MKGMGSELRQNEAVLACAARKGDREALRELLVRNWNWLKGLVYSVVGGSQDVDDCLQEILIGKYIDGEITPSEQGMLDGAMEKDSQVKELLEQLAELHEAGAEAVGAGVLDKGRSAEEIIDLAWRGKKALQVRIFSGGVLRFAAGLAAGLMIGFLLHLVPSGGSLERSDKMEPREIASNAADQADAQTAPAGLRGDVTRNVDYFGFTDDDGGQWLLEGLREDMVRPAVYYGDL